MEDQPLAEFIDPETLEKWKDRSKGVRVYGQGVTHLDRDDLLAVIGCLSLEHERQGGEIQHWMKKAIPCLPPDNPRMEMKGDSKTLADCKRYGFFGLEG